MLSFLGALSVVLEGLELIGPQRLQLVEPRLQGDERSRAQPVHAKTRIMGALILFDFDEATRSEHPQVPTHCWAAHRASRSEFASPPRAFSKEFHHMTPGGVGQRSKRSVKFVIHVLTLE